MSTLSAHAPTASQTLGRASLSVIIITLNESAHIGDCLDSVSFADEIVVVDSGSTDGTREIAQSKGAKVVLTEDWPGFGPQKNRALDLATCEWVLSIDADERVTSELREEILAVLTARAGGTGTGLSAAAGNSSAADANPTAYRIARLSSFGGVGYDIAAGGPTTFSAFSNGERRGSRMWRSTKA